MAELTLLGLRVLQEVAARGSFTRAAAALGYTQSAVSRQVSAMEAAAGTALFERGARGVRPTEAGEMVLRHARAALDAVDTANRELTGRRGLTSGRLRVGAFPTAMAALVPRALAALRGRHAGLTVSVREGTTPAQLRRLAAGTIDLAVVGTLPGHPLDQPGVTVEPLADDPLLVAVARDHELARRPSVALHELAGETWIAGSADPAATFLDAFDPEGWRPQVGFVIREWTAKLGLVAAGLGVTLVPALAAPAVGDGVALVRIRDRQPTRLVAVATRATPGPEPSPEARALTGLLHDLVGELTTATAPDRPAASGTRRP